MTPRFCPQRELPDAPFIPGIGKQPPDPDLLAPMLHSARWMANEPYLWGADLFNAGFFWEAHEAWEAAWHAAPDDTQKSFMQALVQYAAAMLKLKVGPVKTAAVLAERSLGRLQSIADVVVQPYMGCDLAPIITNVRRISSGAKVKPAKVKLAIEPRSRDYLASLTDIWAQPLVTRYFERDGYLVADTPSCRGYYGGHYLLLDRAPAPEDIESWFERWEDDRGALPTTSRYIVWETPVDETWKPPKLADGTVYERIPTMTQAAPMDRTDPPQKITMRRISNEHHWGQVIELATALGVEDHGEKYAAYARWRCEQYRESLRHRGGSWWGAFDRDELVGYLGLFESPSLCRFQEVTTKPSHRGRGVATAMVNRSLTSARSRFGKAMAVICPAEGSQAERIYIRLGFETRSIGHWLMRKA